MFKLVHPQPSWFGYSTGWWERDTLVIDAKIDFDDPRTYTKPFSIKVTHLLQADSDILENVCAENEKDRAHMKGSERGLNVR